MVQLPIERKSMLKNRIAIWSSAGIFLFTLALVFAPWPVATNAQTKAGRGKPADPETDAGPKKIVKSDGEWLKMLSREQFNVTRKGKPEAPGLGKNWSNTKDGVYVCVCCGQPLFDSTAKINGVRGYPCFKSTIDSDAVTIASDKKKIECTRCDANLGQVMANNGQQGGGQPGGGPQQPPNQAQQQQQQLQQQQDQQRREEQERQEQQKRQEELQRQEQIRQEQARQGQDQKQNPNGQPAAGGQPNAGGAQPAAQIQTGGGNQPAGGAQPAGGQQPPPPPPPPAGYCLYNQAIKFIARADFEKAAKKKAAK